MASGVALCLTADTPSSGEISYLDFDGDTPDVDHKHSNKGEKRLEEWI